MAKTEQLTLAYQRDESRRLRLVRQRSFIEEMDEQIAAAMCRWEKALGGLDAHKEMADRLTDDAEHPVSVTQVYDWLSRRNMRRPPAELLAVLYEVDGEFAAWWNSKLGYSAPVRLVLLPLEQERALLRKALLEFGTVGEQKLRAIGFARPEATP